MPDENRPILDSRDRFFARLDACKIITDREISEWSAVETSTVSRMRKGGPYRESTIEKMDAALTELIGNHIDNLTKVLNANKGETDGAKAE